MPATKRRPPAVARRFGYLVAVVVTAAMYYLVNAWPGWEELPFLTGDTRDVLGLVNVSLLIGIVANLVYVAYDPPWFRALGDLATTGVGLAVLVRVWQVYPFDFSGYTANWDAIVRTVLVVAIVASVIGIITQLVLLVRHAVAGGVHAGGGGEVLR